ncbi:hypothetical protein BJV77DRAFT_523270 [Russula vinacea]|nr:hypothetical protein BJV77DRAFT_523270 [Russula vinacea]
MSLVTPVSLNGWRKQVQSEIPKQTRRTRTGSDVEDHAGSSGRRSANVSPVARNQRESRAPPPENIDPEHRTRHSHSASVSPTKSRRRSPALLRSPHADNDKADYILPILPHRSASVRASQSSTPIPPYEPPTERFTPPREIFRSSPRVSKSSKRKKSLSITIKTEPPEIDLSRLPPPSPTDDPLLLHGRVQRPRPSLPTNSRETPLLESTPPRPGKQLSPLNRCALDFPLPASPLMLMTRRYRLS